jgi:hypothetical protein
MKPRQSGGVAAFAVMNMILGGLFLLCGINGIDPDTRKITVNNQDETKHFIEFMNHEAPGFSFWQIGEPVIGLIVGVGLVAAGIGLQIRKNWGRIASLAVASLAIAFKVFQVYYQMAVVNPALKKYLVNSPINLGGFLSGIATAIVLPGAVIVVIYCTCLIVGMLQPATIRALREGIQDEDEEDDFDRPRRRRGRWDEDDEDDEEEYEPLRRRMLRRQEEDADAPPRKRPVSDEDIQNPPPFPKPKRKPRFEDEE